MTNGARVEWLNGFTYFASEAVKAEADQDTGLYGAGKLRLTLDNASGGLVNGNTVEYFDSDGVTGLATATIDSASGSYVYMTDGGTGTFEVPRDRTAKAVSFVDTAEISTAQVKFGASSLNVTQSTTDSITSDPSGDFGFGTGDFTVEFWIYRTASASGRVYIDFRDAAPTDAALTISEGA